MTPVFIYLAWIAALSCATFAAYGFDKRQAVTAGRRLPERTLHLLAFLGGWPGALVGQRLFRHKTAKTSFLIVFWLIVLLHIGIVATLAGTGAW